MVLVVVWISFLQAIKDIDLAHSRVTILSKKESHQSKGRHHHEKEQGGRGEANLLNALNDLDSHLGT